MEFIIVLVGAVTFFLLIIAASMVATSAVYGALSSVIGHAADGVSSFITSERDWWRNIKK